jgi:calcium-translocating P-type ATPase
VQHIPDFLRRRQSGEGKAPPAGKPVSASRKDVVPWHALEAPLVAERLQTSDEGLTSQDARRRLSQVGTNTIEVAASRSTLRRFVEQFKNVLIYILIASALITALIGHWTDSAVIAGVVLLNAAVGFLQEGRAERAIESIAELLSESATVLRDGAPTRIDSKFVVPGDILQIEAGERVPADVRLLSGKGLAAQEAILTGESATVDKQPTALAENTALGSRSSMLYSGTLITRGRGRGIVVSTGSDTELGHINRLLGRVEKLQTPLLRKMEQFARLLAVLILAISAITFAIGVVVHQSPLPDMFMAAVGIAVAAIPEGLPAIMTITLAIGVEEMAKRKALLRRLPGIEALGAVTVICSDKTGTFTRNEMFVDSVAVRSKLLETKINSAAAGDDPELQQMLYAAILCNDAVAQRHAGTWTLEGDPMEAALLQWSIDLDQHPHEVRERYTRLDEVPFDAENRFMATLHDAPDAGKRIYLKGAPERVFSLCFPAPEGNQNAAAEQARWQGCVDTLAEGGMRTLAFAVKNTDVVDDLDAEAFERGFKLLGLVGLIDPPRQEAIEAVRHCQQAGIRVKMITGDYGLTARAIAERLGLANTKDILTGDEIDAMDGDNLKQAVAKVDIFARASPESKLRLVTALQANQQIVAMTGDGVNDAPALKRADIGIAMGKKGAAVARESAEMVLADDNFSSIAAAVEQGRTVYDNIKKSILYILPTSGGEALTIMLAVFAGTQLPITPVQILWVNLVTTVTLALALAFEKPETAVMQRPPRAPDEPLLDTWLIWRVVFVSTIVVAGVFGVFSWMMNQGASLAESRTAAINTLVLFEIFYLFNTRKLSRSVLSDILTTAARPAWLATLVVILLQLALTYMPAANALFGTAPISLPTWAAITVLAATIFILVEIEKHFAAQIFASQAKQQH